MVVAGAAWNAAGVLLLLPLLLLLLLQ